MGIYRFVKRWKCTTDRASVTEGRCPIGGGMKGRERYVYDVREQRD